MGAAGDGDVLVGPASKSNVRAGFFFLTIPFPDPSVGVAGALTVGSGEPSSGSPGSHAASRGSPQRDVFFADVESGVASIQLLRDRQRGVELPLNGSSTRSPGLDDALTIRPNSCSGIWQP